MKVFHTGIPSRHPDEESGIRVWSLNNELEQQLVSTELEPLNKRQRLGLEESEGLQNVGEWSDPEEDEEVDDALEQSLQQLAKKIRKPIGFQLKGAVTWKDPEPQSSRAAHPWILSNERETKENVRDLFKKVINPQVSHKIYMFKYETYGIYAKHFYIFRLKRDEALN